MLTSKGTLRYSPQTLGKTSKWWLVVDCDPNIGKYYRHLYFLENNKCSKIQRPAWEIHISVVRNEEPPNPELWMAHEGEEIEFEYHPPVQNNEIFYWLPVTCEKLLDIRERLGLPRQPDYDLHMTIGNNKCLMN